MDRNIHIENVDPNYLRTEHPKRVGPYSAKFVAYQRECHEIFGNLPTLDIALEHADPIFHEAAVFVPSETQDALFVTSNQFVPRGASAKTILVHKLIRNDRGWTLENIPGCDEIMANGGVNYPSMGSVLFCAQGTTRLPGGLVMMQTEKPYAVRPILTSFHGRWFNSTNDVVVAKDGAIWFTDPSYGHEQGFRPKPQLPCQLYRYDPTRESIRVVADGFGKPNGLCFSPDGQTMYVTDTAWVRGDGDLNDTRPSHIYAFTVEDIHGAPFLTNRRLFAMADAGIPDGIKCDLDGNIYSGCGDGVNIWAPDGLLLGKIMVPGGVANFCFARPGELLLLNETRFWVACVSDHVRGALLDGMGVAV